MLGTRMSSHPFLTMLESFIMSPSYQNYHLLFDSNNLKNIFTLYFDILTHLSYRRRSIMMYVRDSVRPSLTLLILYYTSWVSIPTLAPYEFTGNRTNRSRSTWHKTRTIYHLLNIYCLSLFFLTLFYHFCWCKASLVLGIRLPTRISTRNSDDYTMQTVFARYCILYF